MNHEEKWSNFPPLHWDPPPMLAPRTVPGQNLRPDPKNVGRRPSLELMADPFPSFDTFNRMVGI